MAYHLLMGYSMPKFDSLVNFWIQKKRGREGREIKEKERGKREREIRPLMFELFNGTLSPHGLFNAKIWFIC